MFDKITSWFKGGKKTIEVTADPKITDNSITEPVAKSKENQLTTTSNTKSHNSNITYNNAFNINGSNLSAREIANQVIKI